MILEKVIVTINSFNMLRFQTYFPIMIGKSNITEKWLASSEKFDTGVYERKGRNRIFEVSLMLD